MKVYLAGRYGDLPILRDVAYLLLMAGHEVTSRWLQGNPYFQDTPDERQNCAAMDLEDIDACDLFVLYNHAAPALRQSHSVELDIAIGKRGNWQKTPGIAIVGERSDNVFHWLPQVEHYPTWAALLRAYQEKDGAPPKKPSKPNSDARRHTADCGIHELYCLCTCEFRKAKVRR